MIDTHAHLGDDAPDVLERAHAAGVTRVIAVATTLDGAHRALALADAHDEVYACLGIHPHEAATDEADHVREICTLLGHAKAVAVGETGLDYFRDYAPHAAQQRLFERQLAVARDTGKPVVIHTRAAAREVPHDLLLAETDSPYLAPQPVRGKRNEPAFVTHTYDVLAQLHGEEIRGQIVANAERVFGL